MFLNTQKISYWAEARCKSEFTHSMYCNTQMFRYINVVYGIILITVPLYIIFFFE